MIFLGFGGSRWTSDYANKYMAYIVSVGVKIFAMQLLIGIGQSFVLKFFETFQTNNSQSLVFVGVSIVLLLLVKTIPETLQGLISGNSFGGSGQALLTGSSAAIGGSLGAGLGTVASAAGGGMAVMEAAKLAGVHSGSSLSKAGVAKLATGTIKNLMGSASADLSGKMSGNIAHRHGRMGSRMASHMREKRLSSPPPKQSST